MRTGKAKLLDTEVSTKFLSISWGLEGQQQVLRATFPGIRNSVKELIGRKMDALARQFHATLDMKVKEEIGRLSTGTDKA